MGSVIIKNHFNSIDGCLGWANEIIGNYGPPVPGYGAYIVIRIEQFQIIMYSAESYTIITLVEMGPAIPPGSPH